MNTMVSSGVGELSAAWSAARIVATDASWAQTLLRVTLAGVLLPHGAQHLLGWFGGYGFAGTLTWMTGTLGFPAPLAGAGIALEFFGPVALVLGFGTRAVGAALAVFMAVAASTHAANGFFMNWFGTLPAGVEGLEYHVLAVAMALSVAARGAGAASLDLWLTRRWRLESPGSRI
jgi:putative oxidoreductase